MKKLTVIVLLVLIGCGTTHYKKRDQLPKEVKYIPEKKQFQINVSDIRDSGFRYLKCLGIDERKFIVSDRIPSDIKKVKIIGKYFWWPRGRCYNDRKTRGDFYVSEVQDFGYVFFLKKAIDNKLSKKRNEKYYTNKRKIQEEYDKFLDTLKPNDRELVNSVRFGNYEQMVIALKHKANVNTRDKNSMTVLMLASQNGFIEMTKYLLRKNADVNLITKNNTSALMLVATNGNSRLVKLLIAHGAKINLRENTMRLSAYDMAKFNNHTEVMFLLKSAGAK